MTPPQAGHLGQPFTRHGDDPGGRMSDVEHRGQAQAPSGFAFEVEPLGFVAEVLDVVVVFPFRVEDLSELPFTLPPPASHHTRVVVTGLGIHVGHAGGFHGVDQTSAFFEGNRGRNGANHVLPVLHGVLGHPGMFGDAGENSYGIDPFVFDEVFEVNVGFGLGVLPLQLRPSVPGVVPLRQPLRNPGARASESWLRTHRRQLPCGLSCRPWGQGARRKD